MYNAVIGEVRSGYVSGTENISIKTPDSYYNYLKIQVTPGKKYRVKNRIGDGINVICP
jgi:hypothetical protein